MPNEENVTTKFKVDVSDLKQNISSANKSIQLINAQFKNAVVGTDDWAKTADGLSAKIKQQSQIAEQEQKKLQALKQQLERLAESQKNGEKIIADLTAKHKAAADAYGEDSAEAKELAKQLDLAQKAQERNTKAVENLNLQIVNQDTAVKNAESQVQKYSDALNNLQTEEKQTGDEAQKTTDGGLSAFAVALGDLAANAITAVINKLAELSAAAVDAFKAFDEGRDALIKATGATGDVAAALTDAYAETAKNVSGSLSDIGAAVGEVNTRFGYTGDQLAQTTEDFMKFSEITGVDAVSAVRSVARALNSSGNDLSGYGELLDMLAVAAQASGISADTLAANLTKYGAQMRAVGFDTADTISILSQFEMAGVNSETAVKGIQTAITAWRKEGKNAQGEFSALLADIKNSPNETEAAQKAIEAFGSKAGTELADVIRSGRFEFSNFADTLAKSAGTVNSTYDETQSGIDKINLALQGLSVTAAEYAGKIIDKYGGFVRDIISGVDDVLNGVDRAEEKLTETAGNLVNKSLDEITSKLPDAIKIGVSIVENLVSGIVNSLPSVVDSVGAVATTVLSEIGEFAPKILNKFIDIVPILIDSISSLIPKLIDSVISLGTSIISDIPSIIQKLTDKIPSIFDSVLSTISGAIPQIIEGVGLVFSAVADSLPKLIPMVTGMLPKLVSSIISTISKNAPVFFKSAVSLVKSIVKQLPQLVKLLIPQITGLIKMISEILIENVPILLETALEMFGAIVEAIPEIALECYSAMPDIIDAILRGLADLPDILINYFMGIWQGVARVFEPQKLDKFFSETFGNAFETVCKIWNMVNGYFSAKWEEIKTALEPSRIGKFFSETFGNAWENVKNVFSGVGAYFGGIWATITGKFKGIGTAVGDAIGGAFRMAINAVIGTVERGLNTIPNTVNQMLGFVSAVTGAQIASIPTVSLPRLARGGIVDKSTIAQIGEDGAEAVIPLEKNKAGLKQIASAISDEIHKESAKFDELKTNKGDTIYNFNQTNNSPKALSRYEIYRQTRNMINAVKLEGN